MPRSGVRVPSPPPPNPTARERPEQLMDGVLANHTRPNSTRSSSASASPAASPSTSSSCPRAATSPELALVQVAWGDPADPELAAIDPLEVDVTPFAELVADEGIETIVHAAQADLAILAGSFETAGRAVRGHADHGRLRGLRRPDRPTRRSSRACSACGCTRARNTPSGCAGRSRRSSWRTPSTTSATSRASGASCAPASRAASGSPGRSRSAIGWRPPPGGGPRRRRATAASRAGRA